MICTIDDCISAMSFTGTKEDLIFSKVSKKPMKQVLEFYFEEPIFKSPNVDFFSEGFVGVNFVCSAINSELEKVSFGVFFGNNTESTIDEIKKGNPVFADYNIPEMDLNFDFFYPKDADLQDFLSNAFKQFKAIVEAMIKTLEVIE